MYRVTETESFYPDYEYHEDYEKHEDAQERMRIMYHDIAIPENPVVVRAEFNDNSALVEINDGNIIEWDISEI
jgi:hypothetical protein